jgi:4-hydroxybenzoate polyprenyltransferase
LILIFPLGLKASSFAAALTACIVTYDAIHKRTALAPLLMSACRFLLYLVAATAAQHGTNETVLWRALALASYIIGLSHLARGESTGGVAVRWPLLLLFAPIALTLATGTTTGVVVWMVAAGFVLWILWCVRGGLFRMNLNPGDGVAGLLAGIVLVDWLAAVSAGQPMGLVFAGLFLLAWILQRVAPAT